MMSRDISSHAWRATTTRTHSPAYLHEEILASDGVPRDRDHLRAHGAAHGVDHLDEPYQLLSSVTAPTAPSAVRTHVVKDSLAERHYRAVSAGGSKPESAALDLHRAPAGRRQRGPVGVPADGGSEWPPAAAH